MTEQQRQLARHALGLPNKNNTTYRNHYCTGSGDDGHAEWEDLVSCGLAIKRTSDLWGGDDMFHLTLAGALLARDPKEHLSREDSDQMRKIAELYGPVVKLSMEEVHEVTGFCKRLED